jgi:glycosyltransferase involved in cell wall biosynthesis
MTTIEPVSAPGASPAPPAGEDDRLRFSIALCAYTDRRWSALVRAVESIRRQTLPAHEIILVIDHNEPLLETAKQQFPDVLVVPNSLEGGAGGARNTAAELATGNVLVFLDDDARAVPEWLAEQAEALADGSVIGVGGDIEPDWEGGRPPWFPDEFQWVVGCSYRGLPVASAPVRNLIGCNMSMRLDAFRAIGGFRGGFGNVKVDPQVGQRPRLLERLVTGSAGTEETELCIRATQRWPERQWLYRPSVRVSHEVPLARQTVRYFVARCFDEGVAKATVVSGNVGSKDGLAVERSYTLSVLPPGIVRNLGEAARGDLSGLGRAGAIVVGLAVTVGGYGLGLGQRRRNARALSDTGADPQRPLTPRTP